MSIWSGLQTFFNSPSALGFLALGGANVYSSYVAQDANIEAARLANEGAMANAEAIREGNRRAQERFETLQAQSAPAQSYLRRTMVEAPSTLTPMQKQQLDDLRRDTTATLAANGLRGAGRATVAAVRATESDFRNRAFDSNRARSDRAASQLANQFATASTNAAMLDQDTGKAIGTGMNTAGVNAAGATTANAGLRGQAIGDIASLVRTELKDQERESRYQDRVATATGTKNKQGLG